MKAFFVHGFPKSARDNIRDDELATFKLLAAWLLASLRPTSARQGVSRRDSYGVEAHGGPGHRCFVPRSGKPRVAGDNYDAHCLS